MKTLKELAQEAIDVQNACNLSGIVHSFGRATTDIRAVCPDEGTDFYNRHPISQLWAFKIADLSGFIFTGTNDENTFSIAYAKCQEMAK